MSEDCITCGARPRHQRNIERRCWSPECDNIFSVKSDTAIKLYCSRECQVKEYRSQARPCDYCNGTGEITDYVSHMRCHCIRCDGNGVAS